MRWWIAIVIGLCALPFTGQVYAVVPLVGGDLTVDYQKLRTTEQRAQAGDAEAQFELYNLYGLKQDYALAYEWLERAADNGHKEALFWSFMRYDDGGNFTFYRSKIDYLKAFRRLKQMEGVDAPRAWFDLGRYYRDGKGVKRNYAQAAHYFALSAEAADHRAQIELSQLYAEGRGVKRSDVTAYVWYALGAEQLLQFLSEPRDGFIDCVGPCRQTVSSADVISHRSVLNHRLTPVQLQTAELRIKTFRAKHPLVVMPPVLPPSQILVSVSSHS